MKKKNIIIVIGIILFVFGIVLGVNVVKRNIEDKKTKNKITAIAENFYEETYYITSNKNLLKTFSNIGITISLEELVEFEEANINDYKKYDTSKTIITIYPKEPYEKKDYIVEIELKRN